MWTSAPLKSLNTLALYNQIIIIIFFYFYALGSIIIIIITTTTKYGPILSCSFCRPRNDIIVQMTHEQRKMVESAE